MGLFVRVAIDAFGGAVVDWRQIVIFSSLASIVLGAVGAIGQANIKRLLAYSSINNIGFALIGLAAATPEGIAAVLRSEEHTSELQSLMRNSYAVFCLKKKTTSKQKKQNTQNDIREHKLTQHIQ